MSEQQVPKHYIELCKEISQLARKHGLSKITGSFDPNWKDEFCGSITFCWQQGRHGAESGRIHIAGTMQKYVNIELEEGKKDE